MPSGAEWFHQVVAELERIGLNFYESPYQTFAGEPGGAERFVQSLRELQPGATWRDVFPDMPAHWVADQPSTWTMPYHPFGPYDYQELPTGPALHLGFPTHSDPACLTNLLAAAREAGWLIQGADFLDIPNPKWSTLDAMVILDRVRRKRRLGSSCCGSRRSRTSICSRFHVTLARSNGCAEVAPASSSADFGR